MKVVFIALGVVVLLVVGGIAFVAMNFGSVIKQGIETGGPRVLKVPVEVAEVDFSLFEGKGAIKGFRIGNPDGFDAPHALVVNELAVTLDVATLDQDVIHIHDILLDGPLIVFEGGLSNNNLKQLQQNIESSIPASGETGAPSDGTADETAPKVRIGRFRMKNAEVRLDLDVLDEAESLTLDSLELTEFGSEDLTLAAVAKRVLAGIRDAIAPKARERVEEKARAKAKEKGRELLDRASEKLDEKVGDKLKGLFKR